MDTTVPTNMLSNNISKHNQREILNNRYHATKYGNVEATVNTGSTDYDWATTASGFATIGRATYANIRTSQTISVKFNSASNNAITITSTDSPFEVRGLEMTNIYVTNGSGTNSAVKILLM